MEIEPLMTKPPITCRTSDMLDHAAKLMWDHDIGVLPVVDARGMLIGILTDRDACMAAFLQRLPLHQLAVATVMTTHVVTCRPEDTDHVVATRMSRHKIRRVPVVDDDQRPVGIVSLNDLALAAARGFEVSQREIAGTLAAICEHRS
jgi:CBS domain-containing protein